MNTVELIGYISTVITIVGGLIAIYGLYSKYKNNKDELERWKEDIYQDCEIDQSTRNWLSSKEFITIKGQYKAPHDYKILEDDDNYNYQIEASDDNFDLINKIITGIFSKDRKRYVVLSGSGMGKTTFSAALVHFFLKRIKNRKDQYPIYLHQFGKIMDINTLSQNKQTNSILILDALDENIEAVQDPVGYMQRLEQIVDKFRVVIITCRTQFFANEEDEPKTWSVIQSTPGHQSLVYEKFYLSPIEDEEIKKYFEAKYDLSENYRKALKIKDRTQDLMRRPLFLKFINDLLPLADSNRILIVDIYKKIIEGMLDFERRKCQHESFDEKKLFDFSKKIALLMYDKWVQGKQEYYLTPEEFKDFYTANGYKTNPFTLEEGALLNRSGRGYIQFSHKSFWEFLIAICVIENPYRQFNPSGLPLAVVFYRQIHKLYLKGIKFDYVNYFEPHNVNLKYDVQLLINKIEQMKDTIYNQKYDNEQKSILCRKQLRLLCEEYLQCLPIIIATKELFSFYNNENLNDYSEDLEEARIYGKSVKIGIIDQFDKQIHHLNNLCKEFSFDHLLKGLEFLKAFFQITDNVKESDYEKYYGAHKEILLFPVFSAFKKELKETIFFSYNYIDVGNGFSKDEGIIAFVSSLADARPFIPIFLYREGDDIESHVSFLLQLLDALYKKEQHDTCTIILSLKTKNKHSFYLLNKESPLLNKESPRSKEELHSDLMDLFLYS